MPLNLASLHALTELLAFILQGVHAEWASTGLPLLRCLPAVLLQGAHTVQAAQPSNTTRHMRGIFSRVE